MIGACINRGLIGDSRIQRAILDKELRILIRDQHDFDFYLLHREKLSGSMTEIESFYKQAPELTLYEDEPISTPEVWKVMYKKYNCVVGELTDDAFDKLSNPITYTCYRKIWNIFGFRIQIPFTNQLSTWKHIQKSYLNKFLIVWIKFGQSKKLNEWARQNGKDVWYYTEEINVSKLIEQINGI
ncbi:MAG: hypothetical protein UT94_C0055G0005 [Candidatus Uhrbacteria bacterium GW2011_GWF2_40_263]|nr:MAG: hypothetical protein UT94_C0055G0005 [Candidatus Uhrbacteria bacterium GW2011_GWF2_40_263]